MVSAGAAASEAALDREATIMCPPVALRIRALLSHVQARRAALTLTDQVAVSGTNFVTTVLLGRFCLQEELGLYALGFSLVLLLGGAANALVWMPYMFNSPHQRNGRRLRFTGSVTIHMALFCLLTAVGLGVAAALTAIRGEHPELSGLFAVLAVAGSLMLFREYMRRVYLAQMRPGRALLLNVGMAGIQLAGLATVMRRGMLSSHSAYWVIGASCALLTAAWLVTERTRMKVCWHAVVPDWRRNWKTGRWIFAGSMVRLVSTDIYPWLLAAFHGLPAVAVLAAARGVIVFANPLLLGIGNFAGPFAAHACADHGLRGLRQRVFWGTVAIAAIMGTFCAAVFMWGADVMELLFGSRYAGQAGVVRALALGQLVEAMCIPVGLGLLVAQRANYELIGAVVQLAAMVSAGLWLVWHFGPAGVGYGSAVAYLATGIIGWIGFERTIRRA
jgi:O-antigen/teichoic acid export membrane protein